MHLYEVFITGKFIESRIEFTRGWEERERGVIAMDTVSLWDDEKILEIDSDDDNIDNIVNVPNDTELDT